MTRPAPPRMSPGVTVFPQYSYGQRWIFYPPYRTYYPVYVPVPVYRPYYNPSINYYRYYRYGY